MKFKEYMNSEERDVADTLAKLPKSHTQLVKGYRWKFTAGNTLNGDNEHIGCLDNKRKTITIASPYYYGREYAVLHEIGHQVYGRLSPRSQKQWAQIAKHTKMQKGTRQGVEELFAMAYATHYAKNKMEKFCFPAWNLFIKNLPTDL